MELTQVPDPTGLTFNTTVEERDFYKDNYERLRRGCVDAASEVERLNRLVDRLLGEADGLRHERDETMAEADRLKKELDIEKYPWIGGRDQKTPAERTREVIKLVEKWLEEDNDKHSD